MIHPNGHTCTCLLCTYVHVHQAEFLLYLWEKNYALHVYRKLYQPVLVVLNYTNKFFSPDQGHVISNLSNIDPRWKFDYNDYKLSLDLNTPKDNASD